MAETANAAAIKDASGSRWRRIANAVALLAALKQRWPVDEDSEDRAKIVFLSENRPEWAVPTAKNAVLSSWGLPEVKPRARKETVKMERVPGFGWFGYSASRNALLVYLEESQMELLLEPVSATKDAPTPQAAVRPHRKIESATRGTTGARRADALPPPLPEVRAEISPAGPLAVLRRALPVLEKHAPELAEEARRLLKDNDRPA